MRGRRRQRAARPWSSRSGVSFERRKPEATRPAGLVDSMAVAVFPWCTSVVPDAHLRASATSRLSGRGRYERGAGMRVREGDVLRFPGRKVGFAGHRVRVVEVIGPRGEPPYRVR
ncbi:DUF1918 domain-containing protein [Streptomyces sp. NPDC007355]|uniref:DUF1918 domain-containing protein n=1 Tax=Streptomyces sp. NPDC007355 TaxID=3364778 RepID=UPI0036AE2FA9